MARAKTLHKPYASNPAVCYVYVAEYCDRPAAAAVVMNSHGDATASGSIHTRHPEGEGTAIALALASTSATIIVSDSKTAIRNYATGRVSAQAANIIRAFTGGSF